MLISLSIENFAVINKTAFQPHDRFTAITGETGAGKSVLIETLTLLQGARADKSHIQSGKQSASIEGSFCIQGNLAATNWLKQQGFRKTDSCHIKRIIDASGKSKAFINEQACTLQTLKTLGPLLVRIHAQHQYHTLLDKDKQLLCLDQYAGLEFARDKCQRAYQLWREAVEGLKQARHNYASTKQRHELLQYQTTELNQLDLSKETLQSAYLQHQQLNHTEATLALCQQVRELLEGDEQWSMTNLNHRAQHALGNQKVLIKPLEEARKLLEEQNILLEECVSHIETAQEQLEHDPGTLSELNQYLDQVGALARKHHVQPEALPELAQSLCEELVDLENNGLNIDGLALAAETAWTNYLEEALQLSRARQHAAKKISQKLTEYIQQLGMPEAKISFKLEQTVEINAKQNNHTNASDTQHSPSTEQLASPVGIDQGELMFTTHPQLPMNPLRKTASGGELSRISLALFMLCQQGLNELSNKSRPILVFDEVDTGMGGETGDLLGIHLKSLSEKQQVICITHLPQIAARSDRHICVTKSSNRKGLSSQAKTLNEKERHTELARMIGINSLPRSLVSAAGNQLRTNNHNTRINNKALRQAAQS